MEEGRRVTKVEEGKGNKRGRGERVTKRKEEEGKQKWKRGEG